MKKYYLIFVNEFGQEGTQFYETDDFKKVLSEIQNLQQILDKDKKEAGAHYIIYQREGRGISDTVAFSAKEN